jgi:hypothetical protein
MIFTGVVCRNMRVLDRGGLRRKFQRRFVNDT